MKLIVAALGLTAAIAAGAPSPQPEPKPSPPIFRPPPTACGICANQPLPNRFCREVCHCNSAFCGRW